VQDRGRLLDLGQVNDHDVVVLAGIGVDRNGAVDEDPFAIRGVLVVGNVRAGTSQSGSVEPSAQFAVERPDDGSDGPGLEARCGGGELCDPYPRDAFDLDVVCRHGALTLDDSEPRLDLRQPGRVGRDLRLQLGPPQP
jgi:hypothetical protein